MKPDNTDNLLLKNENTKVQIFQIFITERILLQ